MKPAMNRKHPTSALACAAVLFATLLASCGSSTGPVPISTTDRTAVVPTNNSPKPVEKSGLSGTWLIKRIEVDGVPSELEIKDLALAVTESGNSAKFSFLLFSGSTECSLEGGEWFHYASKLYLDKLYLQNAVGCELTRPSWVSLLRPAITNGSLSWNSQNNTATLRSELVDIQLVRK